jgi:N-acetylglutamate synthase-like GNAT family acetyltransferase
MDYDHARQIAELLNSQNRLVVQYDADLVLKSAANYLYDISDTGEIVACVELKKAQWYQFEIDHLTVASAATRKGFAEGLVRRCEERATQQRGRVFQCTIRVGNTPSEKLFKKAGFTRVSQFYYSLSQNDVGVWQKVISSAKGSAQQND